MSWQRHLLKNPLFLYHPSKNILYKGESRYCIEETLVQTSPGGNGMLFLSVYSLLHNTWLAQRQTSPGFPMPATGWSCSTYGKKLHQNYVWPVPCCSPPKNHLLGKHPFPPCLFYVWPNVTQERPRGSVWLPSVLAPSLCVSLYFMHRNGMGGHRIGELP